MSLSEEQKEIIKTMINSIEPEINAIVMERDDVYSLLRRDNAGDIPEADISLNYVINSKIRMKNHAQNIMNMLSAIR